MFLFVGNSCFLLISPRAYFMYRAMLNLAPLSAAAPNTAPYPHVMASGLLSADSMEALNRDFPNINKPGFFPLELLKGQGESFNRLVEELNGPTIAEVLSEKLGIDLRGKPRMITVRKWSAAKDGRIHNDGEAKICTSLLYLNPTWEAKEDGGRFRVLTSDRSFDDSVSEFAPIFGNFLAFKRTENSWHGHKPFVGERRVIQITWLRSQEEYDRKFKRGRLSYFLKRLLPWTSNY